MTQQEIKIKAYIYDNQKTKGRNEVLYFFKAYSARGKIDD